MDCTDLIEAIEERLEATIDALVARRLDALEAEKDAFAILLPRVQALEQLWDEHTAHAHGGPDGPVIRPVPEPRGVFTRALAAKAAHTPPEPEPLPSDGGDLWWSPMGRPMKAWAVKATFFRTRGYMKHGEWVSHRGGRECPVPPNAVVEVEWSPTSSFVGKAGAPNWVLVRRYRVVGFVPKDGDAP